MKKIVLLFLTLVATGFAENIIFDNETSFPNKNQKSKIAVQWAASGEEVDEGNEALMHGEKLDPKSLHVVKQAGKVTIRIPKNAEYFRVLAWSNGEGDPDLHTNWVDIVPDKTYTLREDQLVPTVLMQGTGC